MTAGIHDLGERPDRRGAGDAAPPRRGPRLRPVAAKAVTDWASAGACRDVDPESLFVVGAAQHKAKLICSGCAVRIDCLADALDSRTEFGVWGGMTERERRVLLRRRPDIRSWRRVLVPPGRRAES